MKYKYISFLVGFILLLNAGSAQQNDNSARELKRTATEHQRLYDDSESEQGAQFFRRAQKKPMDPLTKAYREARRQGDVQKMRELEKQLKRSSLDRGESKGQLIRRISTTVGYPGQPKFEGSNNSPDWGNDIHVRSVNTDFRESHPAMATASDGTIYICWENVGQSGTNDYVQVYYSTDGGENWTAYGYIENPSYNLREPSLAIGEGGDNILLIAYIVDDGVVPFPEVATSPLISAGFNWTIRAVPYWNWWDGYAKPNIWTDSYDWFGWFGYLTCEGIYDGATSDYNVCFWRSVDYGATWQDEQAILGDINTDAWRDPDGTYGTIGNKLFVACFNQTDNTLYTRISYNFGATWVDTVAIYTMTAIPFNPVDPDIEAAANYDHVMLCCTKSFSGADNAAQAFSTDGGYTWSYLYSLEGYTATNEFAIDLTANEGGNNWHVCYTSADWWVYYSTRPQDLSGFWQPVPDQVNDVDWASAAYPKKAISSNWGTDEAGIAWADYRQGAPDYDIYFDHFTNASLYQGPASGSIAGGASQNTANFPLMVGRMTLPEKTLEKMIPLQETPRAPVPPNMIEPLAPIGSNEFDDPGAPAIDQPMLITDFAGIPDDQNSAGFRFFPPDPICAAGPNHVMAATNTDFAIFDKNGVKIKEIDATLWFENVLPGLDPALSEPFGIAYDPQIVYDHFADHWVMIYVADDNTSQSYLLLSVSDDSDPIGVWYNYAVPGNANGSNFNTYFNDYPKLGIDDYNFYITANMFDLAGSGFQYVQLRIIEKFQIYNNLGGPLAFIDFWDLRDPDNLFQKLNPDATVAPAVTFGSPGVEYLINASPYASGTFMTVWTVPNPASPASLTAVNVPVTAYDYPPDAGQPGSPPLEPIDTGGWRVRNSVFRNGFLWTAHSVADASGSYARARYVKIDVGGPSVLEDLSYGLTDYWYYYPAITADAMGNSLMVFNRSGGTEFAGIRFTGTEAGTAYPSFPLKAGEGDYERVDGANRNRWGDYSGIAVDPANPNNVWMFSEYATDNSVFWGTWWGEVSFSIQTPPPENLVAMDGYDGAVPLYWDPPAGHAPLKMNSQLDAFSNPIHPELMMSRKTVDVSPNGDGFSSPDQILQYYDVYRSTNPGGPYNLIASGINRQYYRDLSVSNGGTYYYVVTAQYDVGASGNSNEDNGSPVLDGYVINSGFTGSPPTLDGSINVSEWSAATQTVITGSGVPNPVTLFTMNDGNFLYMAVDDPNNTNPDDYDELGLYFDEDHNFEWPPSLPSGEGNFWIDHMTTPPSTSRYRGFSGWWPANLVPDTPVTAAGVNQATSFSSGHVQFEVQIDLSASELNASPGNDIGWYMFSYDAGSGLVFGNWPTDVSPFGGGTWSGPFSYGTLVLATSILPPDIDVIPSSFIFNLPVGGTASDILTISNTASPGSGDLIWNITEQDMTVVLSDRRELPVAVLPANLEVQTNSIKLRPGVSGGNDIMVNRSDRQALGQEVAFLKELVGTTSSERVRGSDDVFIPSSRFAANTLLIEFTSLVNSVERALNELSVVYDIMFTSDFTTIDFTPYTTIIIGLDGGAISEASVQAVANEAASGKDLIMLGGTSFASYYTGIQNYLLQHNGTTGWLISSSPHLTVTNPGHPLAPGLPSPYDYIDPSAAYYMLRITDPAASVAAMNGDGFPALVSKPIGSGNLVYAISSPYDGYYTNDPDYQVLKTIVQNALGLTDCPWLSESPTSGITAPNNSDVVTINVDATGLTPGTYNCNLLISSNDPDENPVIVPVTLNVGGLPGNVEASVLCPPSAPQGCPITAEIKIDMTNALPPDDLLGSFTGTLTWDPTLLDYVSHSGILSGYTGIVNVDAPNGIITFNGAKPTGTSGVVDILNIDFDVIGPVGATATLDLEFSAMAAAFTFNNLLPILTVHDCTMDIIQGGLLGDVNDDGAVNSTDALVILSYDAGLALPQPFIDRINAGFGDVNSDGNTNSTDALIVLSYDVGIPVPFPVGQPFCP